MPNNRFNPSVMEEALGAVTVGLVILASPLLREDP